MVIIYGRGAVDRVCKKTHPPGLNKKTWVSQLLRGAVLSTSDFQNSNFGIPPSAINNDHSLKVAKCNDCPMHRFGDPPHKRVVELIYPAPPTDVLVPPPAVVNAHSL